jgi:F1F0 ATPase subunit 2
MTKFEILNLGFIFAVGVFLGIVYFGGLWWTIRKGLSSPQPALWFFCSLLARMGIALLGFYFVSDGRWENLLACLIGFIFARLLVTHSKITRLEVANAPHP